MRRALFIILFSGAVSAYAQSKGSLEEIKDPKIDSLIAWRTSAAGKTGYGSLNGYRVQFFSGGNRKAAYDAQDRFQEMFPSMRTYISYIEPNYKVRGGDFRTRLDAQRFMQEIRPQFPTLFLIPEKINPPKLDTSDAQ
ncbi:MAG: SPOR domain-containing protein [Mucilaginibacter polytrichastri]|nr:SPOR domain-containing protein [Mucilaginibacter polytrichastri]